MLLIILIILAIVFLAGGFSTRGHSRYGTYSTPGWAEQLIEASVEGGDVAWGNQEASDAVLDHLGQTAHVAGDHWRATGHRFQRNESEQL